MHPVPVFANDSLLRMSRWLQRCVLSSSRSIEWMLFLKGISDVLRYWLNFLRGGLRARAKSATHIRFRGRQKNGYLYRAIISRTCFRAKWGAASVCGPR